MQAHPELLGVILFTDESSFTRDGVNNSRNVHMWSQDNPHETTVTTFQSRFSVNVWCGVIGDRLIGPFVFENNLTRPQNKQLHTQRITDYKHTRQDRRIQKEMASTHTKNATKLNPSKILQLQTARKKINWTT